MGGSSKKQTVGYRYYMSLLMGLTRGPVDEIVQIRVGDLRAWPVPERDTTSIGSGTFAQLVEKLRAMSARAQASGVMTIAAGPDGTSVAQMDTGESVVMGAADRNTITGSGNYRIEAANLFGGDKKEGGIQGSLQVAMGESNQDRRSWYSAKGMTGNIPGFRGFASVLFDGLICSLNPYPKKWSYRLRRTGSGWDGAVWQPGLCAIWLDEGRIKSMNPAHIVYECLTNRDWGRGLSRDWIDEPSFLKAAEALHSEGFGLCMKWTRETPLDEFIGSVIDHVGGSLYTDRASGRIGLKLLRGDYAPSEVPLFTYDTGLLSVDDPETASQNDLINEVIVEWFDPVLNETRQSRSQNLAAMQSMGAANSSKRSYSGIPTATLAMRVAQRDLKAGAAALKRYTVTLDRRAWRIVPGDVFRISAPDMSISDLILRAGKVTESGGRDGRIKVAATIDVYGLPASAFAATEVSEWAEPDRTPTVATKRHVRETTYGELVQLIDPANLKEVAPLSGYVAALVGRPTALTQGYNLATAATGESFESRGSGIFTPVVTLTSPLTLTTTTVAFDEGTDLGVVEVGMSVQINDEICRLDAIDSADGVSGTITIARGCVDTIPQTHPNRSIAYIFNADALGTDDREYVNGETVRVKVLTRTSTAELDMPTAPVNSVVINSRQSRPWAPGRLLVNGTPYAQLTAAITGDVTLTWAHRNRLVIQDKLISQDEPGVGAQEGVTYRVRVYRGNTLVREVEDIVGNTFVYDGTMMAEDGITDNARFTLFAREGGRWSQVGYDFSVNTIMAGYGNNYGDSYGS